MNRRSDGAINGGVIPTEVASFVPDRGDTKGDRAGSRARGFRGTFLMCQSVASSMETRRRGR